MNSTKREDGLVLIVGQIATLERAMVGEPGGVSGELRGTTGQKAAWMAREQFIATVRLAASRNIPVWIAQDSEFSSLAAMILSEYAQADVAEGSGPIQGHGPERKYPLNFFKATPTSRTPAGTLAWQTVYKELGVIAPAEDTLTLAQVLENMKLKLIVCIGSGPKVSSAMRLAKQRKIHVEFLDFSKESSEKLGDNGLEARLLKVRKSIHVTRTRSARGQFENEAISELQIPPDFHLFPPVPLLIYWQLEDLLPLREI